MRLVRGWVIPVAAILFSSCAGAQRVDDSTRKQAAAIWSEHCSKCHGIDGEPPDASAQTYAGPPPRTWGTFGTSMGFFFGGDKMRAGLFRIISEGGAKKEDGTASAMPAWGETLSREQIWALVDHLESF